MEISKTNQMRTKSIYSELAPARESATVPCGLSETQWQGEEWGRWKASGVPCLEYDLVKLEAG